MLTPPSFSDALRTEVQLALSRAGVSLLDAAVRGSGNEKARVWGEAIAHGLVSQEPLLLDERHAWNVNSDKHGQMQFQSNNLETNRVVHRFAVRAAQRVTPVKHHNWLLGQQQLVFGRPDDTSWMRASQAIYTAWQQEIKLGRLDWNAIDSSTVQSWQTTLLGAWKESLGLGEEAANHAFLDFCLGTHDTYWVHKIPRKDQLHLVGVSRSGRLGMPKTSTPVALSGTAQLLHTEDGVFFEVPLTSGGAIRGSVHDHRNLQGPTVRLSWFLESPQTQGLRLPIESLN